MIKKITMSSFLMSDSPASPPAKKDDAKKEDFFSPKSMNFLGVNMTMPAYIVLIAGIVLVVIQTIFLISRSKRSKMLPHVIIINIVLMLLLAALNVYIVNCLTAGNCNALAIIITGFYLLAVANALIYFVSHNGRFLGLKGK